METKRIIVIGTTGTGKTTLARKLSKKLAIPHIELDALYWEPNWKEAHDEDFLLRIEKAIHLESWIVDGNYTSTVSELIWPKAQLVIWLDYSFHTIFFRLLRRTITRSLSKEELWPGCHENLKIQFLSKRSILLWLFKSYGRRRRKFPAALARYPHLKVMRIRSKKDRTNLEIAFFPQSE